MALHPYVRKIRTLFEANGETKRAEGAKAYMRDQFEFFGITTPDRRKLQAVFFKSTSLPPIEDANRIVQELWSMKERELHYFAMEFLLKYRKKLRKDDLKLLEFLITTNSWWDTVDVIAPKLFLEWSYLFPNEKLKTVRRWNNSGNLWLIRSSIIFQLHDKKSFNEDLLFEMILQQTDHKDFFIRKAIGWSLRQYAKTNPSAVRQFVNANEMSPLSKKEALKHF
jgi:3-methyladenine DNA glycosylase AlkD